MDKRIVLTLAGAAVVAAVVWLTTRPGDYGVQSERASSTNVTMPVTPPSTERVSSPAPMTPTTPTTGEALPIDVSPGFEYLSKPAAEMNDSDGGWFVWRRHQQLQSESRDEAWAPRMEAALRNGIQDSLTALGFDTQRIELPVVECRTTGCEIQAVGYPGDQKKGVDIQLLLPPLLQGSLAGEFDLDDRSMIFGVRQDQRLIVLTQLGRKKP